MALDISKEVEALVIEDRKAGMSYAAIVEKYTEHGVTVKWAKRVCKDIKVIKMASSPQQAIAAILPLATRPIGVKPSEYFHILKACYGTVYDEEQEYERLNMTSGQKSYVKAQVKEKALKLGKVAYFVPEWLDTKHPEDCNKLMLTLAQSLYDSVEAQITCFFEAYPELGEKRGGGYSVRQELFSLVVNGYAPEGINKRCERNQEAVEFLCGAELQEREYSYPVIIREGAYENLEQHVGRSFTNRPAKEDRPAMVAAITQPALPMKETPEAIESFESLIDSLGY